ncbi:MalY/PatB family protein [Alkalicoccus daliensis]|uniref:cysteine-S-conjugate beta-lyase n=1 Tax=Alkalicoccus daliensis TaxID=745820 RepID=A0A1H0I0W3_9BACI|nr:PatB family C-S lyase [Alkalicoccus daliensis]SDO25092.1 cystathione beta-lyase [Alkalicoccus daliensis]
MHYFQEFINRKDTYSVKWDYAKTVFKSENELLPMWVADMDFHPPEAVTEAIKSRAEHGLYGYTFIADDMKETIKKWMKKRFGWEIQNEWLQFSHGVVPSIGKAVQGLTEPGDKILVQSPVYPPFFSMIKDNDRELVNCPLEEKNGKYVIDFHAFEEKLKTGVKMFLLCSPHNPVGRVWSRGELQQIADLCLKYEVIIISDEIHGDLVFQPNKQIPIASLSPEISARTITLVAPSKTFNLAGLQASAVITENKDYRRALEKIDKKNGVSMLNTFGVLAMQAAYEHGENWLEELLVYLDGNVHLVDSFLQEELPQIKAIKPEATYLLWIDCRETGLSDAELNKRLIEEGRIAMNPGTSFGEGGSGFVRMNIACPRDTVQEGLKRLKKALASSSVSS